MRFAYYERLSAASQRTYRKSDRITEVTLSDSAALALLAAAIAPALEQADRHGVRAACQALVDGLNGSGPFWGLKLLRLFKHACA